MKLAVFSTYSYDQEFLSKFNTGHELVYFTVPLNEQTALLTNGFDAICVFVNDAVNAAVLQILHTNGVKLIVLRCAGFNNVAITTATALGIAVYRVPAYSPEAVAEHAMALILTLNRKTHKAYNRIREGNFSIEKLMGFNLHNRKVAVIGTGNIGTALCRILKGFGCLVHAYDIAPNPLLAAEGVRYGSLEETLTDADIVSLHCPLTEHNRYMINEHTLKNFRPGAMLINTSRGGLINTAHVIEALKTGQLGALGLDVYEQESQLFFHDHSEDVIKDDIITHLISFPNVLITSHQGFFTEEAMSEIAKITFENIDGFIAHHALPGRVVTA